MHYFLVAGSLTVPVQLALPVDCGSGRQESQDGTGRDSAGYLLDPSTIFTWGYWISVCGGMLSAHRYVQHLSDFVLFCRQLRDCYNACLMHAGYG